MKSSHYLAIAVRLFAIALFLYSLRQSALLIEVAVNSGINGLNVSIAFALGSTVSLLIAAALLWYFPLTVANSILRPELDLPVEPVNAQSILTVLVLAIGLFALYFAVMDSIYWLTFWHINGHSHYSEAMQWLNNENKSMMIATAIELAGSIAIILKARSLAYRLLRLTE